MSYKRCSGLSHSSKCRLQGLFMGVCTRVYNLDLGSGPYVVYTWDVAQKQGPPRFFDYSQLYFCGGRSTFHPPPFSFLRQKEKYGWFTCLQLIDVRSDHNAERLMSSINCQFYMLLQLKFGYDFGMAPP